MHAKLKRILPDLAVIADHATLKASGYMDLNVDILTRTNTYTDIALSHYFRHPCGDMIADPDMEVRIWTHGAVEALTYQDCFGYRAVYHIEGDRVLVDTRAKRQLNAFLNTWLSNLLAQGHSLSMEAQA